MARIRAAAPWRERRAASFMFIKGKGAPTPLPAPLCLHTTCQQSHFLRLAKPSHITPLVSQLLLLQTPHSHPLSTEKGKRSRQQDMMQTGSLQAAAHLH